MELVCDDCHVRIHEELRKKPEQKKHKRYVVNKDGTVIAKEKAGTDQHGSKVFKKKTKGGQADEL